MKFKLFFRKKTWSTDCLSYKANAIHIQAAIKKYSLSKTYFFQRNNPQKQAAGDTYK